MIPVGAAVTWLDSRGERRYGVVTEHPNPPPHADGRYFVLETIACEASHWIVAADLEVAPVPGNEREGA